MMPVINTILIGLIINCLKYPNYTKNTILERVIYRIHQLVDVSRHATNDDVTPSDEQQVMRPLVVEGYIPS